MCDSSGSGALIFLSERFEIGAGVPAPDTVHMVDLVEIILMLHIYIPYLVGQAMLWIY